MGGRGGGGWGGGGLGGQAPGIPRLVPGWRTFLQIRINSKLLPGCCHAPLRTTPYFLSHRGIDRQDAIVTVLVCQTSEQVATHL